MRLGGFDETFDVSEDYDLWLRIAADTPVLPISEPPVVKRGARGSIVPLHLGTGPISCPGAGETASIVRYSAGQLFVDITVHYRIVSAPQ